MRFISKRSCRSSHAPLSSALNRGALGDARADERSGLAFSSEHCRDRCAATFADDDDNFALAVLIASEATVKAIFLQVGGLDVAAKIYAINLSLLAFLAAMELEGVVLEEI
jgi:hypothetical protein